MYTCLCKTRSEKLQTVLQLEKKESVHKNLNYKKTSEKQKYTKKTVRRHCMQHAESASTERGISRRIVRTTSIFMEQKKTQGTEKIVVGSIFFFSFQQCFWKPSFLKLKFHIF